MYCPRCNHEDTKVLETRLGKGNHSIRRRRECLACGHRFSTMEEIVREGLVVVKRNGAREEFDIGKIAAGVRKAKELATWLEGQPMWMYAGIMAELLHKVARHAPPAIGRSLARRALLIAPRVGIWAPAGTLIYFSAAIIHRRLGNVLKVRAYCRELLRLCPQEGSRNFWYLPYYFQSELLGLEGKDSEALPLAEKSLALIKQYGAFDVRLGLQAMLYCAQVNESSGHLKAARQYYREYLDAKCYQWLKPAVSIKQAWDGFHRTKEPARPKF